MIISIILTAITAYLVAGLLFAIPFVIKGVQKLDDGAIGSGTGFRIIIIPGTMLFWPLLLRRWVKAAKNKIK